MNSIEINNNMFIDNYIIFLHWIYFWIEYSEKNILIILFIDIIILIKFNNKAKYKAMKLAILLWFFLIIKRLLYRCVLFLLLMC